MKFMIKVFFVLAVAMALIISIGAVMPREEEDESEQPSSSTSSLEGMGRFLREKNNPRQGLTCNKSPRICRAKGSPGLIAARRNVSMCRQIDSIVGCVGRSASTTRYVAKVNVSIHPPIRSTAGDATTGARKGAPVH
ncbi:hypothetical protein NE237_032203 [Protea cynaroides]|uniref:Uncharacterized protein n=1 Tax=Protea cynaroides TaxID=273540 RepID=A0A9Q0L3Y7_9MAGN|nr:hypothetical protein NE237_032203 [Protea cynaroides]